MRTLAIPTLLCLLLTTSCAIEGEMERTVQAATVLDGASATDGDETADEQQEPATESPTSAARPSKDRLPADEPFLPADLFDARGEPLNRRVMEANPRIHLYKDFSPADRPGRRPILIIGMPGWGGRSENFIWTLVNGLRQPDLTHRLIVASIQDLNNGGPGYQGQGSRDHANVWSVTRESVEAMDHFITRLGTRFGQLQVYLMGFSTGGTAAPLMATRLAAAPGAIAEKYRVAGAIAMGTPSPVSARRLKEHGQRVLFLVVPTRLPTEPKPLRDDQWNRISAEQVQQELAGSGAMAYLRHITTARRHVDWHWGLVSQCRYFRTARIDKGRGYWPNYWAPNPETMAHMRAFLLGDEPPAEGTASTPHQQCPY